MKEFGALTSQISENLSIVLQGGISIGNAVQIANHCRHWRQLFPHAEIILSISTNELFRCSVDEDGKVDSDLKLLKTHSPNFVASNALKIIKSECDAIVFADPGLPLPSIKPTDRSNNSDFMIGAARAGLKAATKEYVLRIRSDVIFLDRTFISIYVSNFNLPRRFKNMLEQRVMICNLFTVNPYTIERLPFHYSDWFNFGLLDDVRKIWDVDFMPYAYTLHYKVHPHKAGSNFRETNFNTRIGVEQYVYSSFLKREGYDLSLDYHNDTRSITESMMVLENDFIIGDASTLKVITQERSDYLTFDWVEYVCIHFGEWRALFDTNPSDYRNIFLRKIEMAKKVIEQAEG